VWPIATDGVAWSVCLSVCLLVYRYKRSWTSLDTVWDVDLAGPRNHVLDGVQIPTQEGAIFEGEKVLAQDMPRHVAVDILKVTQQGAARVQCGCQL